MWCQNIFAHPQEIWNCVSCPAPEHAELVCTTFSTGAQLQSKLWRMDGVADAPAMADASGPPAPPKPAPLSEVVQLGGGTPLREHLGIVWNAVLPEQVISLTKKQLSLYTLTHGARASTAAESATAAPPVEGGVFSCGRWDPHHAHSLGVGCGGSVLSMDMRTMKAAHTVSGAHTQRVRGLDYNPNKPYVVLSCGDDYAIRYWDLRKPSASLLMVKAHSHWTTSALYNRFHDQLVLSCGARLAFAPRLRASPCPRARNGRSVASFSSPSAARCSPHRLPPLRRPRLRRHRLHGEAVARRVDLILAARCGRRRARAQRRRRRRPRQGI